MIIEINDFVNKSEALITDFTDFLLKTILTSFL